MKNGISWLRLFWKLRMPSGVFALVCNRLLIVDMSPPAWMWLPCLFLPYLSEAAATGVTEFGFESAKARAHATALDHAH